MKPGGAGEAGEMGGISGGSVNVGGLEQETGVLPAVFQGGQCRTAGVRWRVGMWRGRHWRTAIVWRRQEIGTWLPWQFFLF